MEYSRSINVTARRPSSCDETAHAHVAPDEGPRDFGRTPTVHRRRFSIIGGRSTWTHEHLLPIFVLMAVPFPGFHLMMGDIAFIINYYINQMCGRPRPGLLQALVSVITFWLLTTRFRDYWYDLFPAQNLEKSSNALAVIAGCIFGTGLSEEGFKAVPLMELALISAAFAFLSRRTGSRLSALLCGVTEHFGLREPLCIPDHRIAKLQSAVQLLTPNKSSPGRSQAETTASARHRRRPLLLARLALCLPPQ